ncbi:MAG: PAS domain S-box protein [Deltaproteobacteria bacterium]|nr:PAS domain S-box protein [Deltaproteobacteria bacterium]
MSERFIFEATGENLRALLDQSLTGIFIVTAERIRFANRTFEEMLGYDSAELQTMDPWAHVHPDEREAVRNLGRERIDGQRSRNVYETRMLRKDGVEIWVEVRATPIVYEDQAAVLVNMVDIADRKNTEQRLRKSEASLRSLFEQAPIGIYRATPEGTLLMANPALRRMLGADEAGPDLKREDFEPTHPKSEFKRHMDQHGAVRGLESAWIRQDNSLIYVREYAQAIFDEHGDVLAYEGAVEDVTHRKRAEQALQLYTQRLQVMQEVERAILAANSSEAIVQAVVKRIRRLIPCDRATLLLFDRKHDMATVAAVDEDPAPRFEPVEGACLPLDDLSSMEQIEKSSIRIIRDIQGLSNPRKVHTRLLAQGLRSVLSVPIRFDTELIGELNLASRRPHAFDAQQEKAAAEIGSQLAVGLRQARLLGDLRQERERLHGLVEHLPEGLILLDVERRILMANPMARRLLPLLTAEDPLSPEGVTEGQILEHLGELHLEPTHWKVGKPIGPIELSGGDRRIEATGYPVPLAEHGGCVLVLRDVTREREVRLQLQQQERLAAVGELAGGVAHDFNNLLTAVDGFADILKRRVGEDHPGRNNIEEIKRVCERGSALTRRLLAFSRRREPVPEAVDLNALIRDIEEMLRRLLGSPVQLRTELATELHPILSHKEQVEQVLVNLSINARDAMPDGGVLKIRTDNADRPVELESGPDKWIRLEVSDTGSGMDGVTKQRIFEPFFTTREEEGGTGLGLSTVKGIVKGVGGLVQVETEPGQGTIFRIYLPALIDSENPTDHANL